GDPQLARRTATATIRRAASSTGARDAEICPRGGWRRGGPVDRSSRDHGISERVELEGQLPASPELVGSVDGAGRSKRFKRNAGDDPVLHGSRTAALSRRRNRIHQAQARGTPGSSAQALGREGEPLGTGRRGVAGRI